VHFDHYDEHGYSALDYTVLGTNERMRVVTLEGLREEFSRLRVNGRPLGHGQIDVRVAAQTTEAQRRKKYREIFQKSFRPWLRGYTSDGLNIELEEQRISSEAGNCLRTLRRLYAQQLAGSENKSEVFDKLKYMRLSYFKAKLTKLPGPHDTDDIREVVNLIQEYQVQAEDSPGRSSHEDNYIMFLLYRWLGRGSPDDSFNTQYNRMKHALELFLDKHPWLDPDKVLVWLVSLSFLLLRLQSD
jgi:hypothetical protein